MPNIAKYIGMSQEASTKTSLYSFSYKILKSVQNDRFIFYTRKAISFERITNSNNH